MEDQKNHAECLTAALDNMLKSSNGIVAISQNEGICDLKTARELIIIQHNMIISLVKNFKTTGSELQKSLNNFYKMKHQRDVAKQIAEERISEN
ncbi:MAG TPA: hypothetical protein VL442_22920 [Mucilaginibacter sp.]|jgi:hypothetical protein|nr:hypothetical protein [Mucilaginibacter sp.]